MSLEQKFLGYVVNEKAVNLIKIQNVLKGRMLINVCWT